MTITTITSREFNQRASAVRRETSKGPVFITDRGKPAQVLLSIEEYNKLTGNEMTALAAIAQPGGPEYDFEFEPPRLNIKIRPAELD